MSLKTIYMLLNSSIIDSIILSMVQLALTNSRD